MNELALFAGAGGATSNVPGVENFDGSMSDPKPHVTYDKELIRQRLSFPEVFGKEIGTMQRSGATYVAPCPFHEERSASYHIWEDHGHCYGCGVHHSDIFAFWMARREVDFATALEQLAGLCGVYPTVDTSIAFRHASYNVAAEGTTALAERPKEKPATPKLYRPQSRHIQQLAELRDLSPLGVLQAVDKGLVYVCKWPQWHRTKTDGAWVEPEDAVPSWVVTDPERWVVQYRRYDGGKYTMRRGESQTEIKAWTKGSPKWPLGTKLIGEKHSVLLVEGGADMLAAYHFLHALDIGDIWASTPQRRRRCLQDEVAVVCMLGSSNKIADDALPYFAGKRVRIIMDADQPKKKPNGKTYTPSEEAATRWTKQLTGAGAAVKAFSLQGLYTPDREAITDLNDLVYLDDETWNTERLEDAFFAWDF